MAVVNMRSSVWNNSDGLSVYFPADAGKIEIGGEVQNSNKHTTRVNLNLLNLSTAATAASGNEVILGDSVIPAGAYIEKVTVLVTTETAGTNANLDLGFVKTDRSTELDFNGLLAAADAFNSGTDIGLLTEYVVGTTEAGALIGTILAFDGILTASADTADWTAGVLRIDIDWSIV